MDRDVLRRLIDAMFPNRAAPCLARVLKAHEGPGKTAYSVDVKVLTAGTLEDTAQDIADVPLSPIWASKKKRGLYAIPPEGQVVIVEFLHWNPAFPYVSGVWSDEYEADEFAKDKFFLTDGEGMKIVIDATDAKTITIDNGQGASAAFSPDRLTCAYKNKCAVLLEDDHLKASTDKCKVEMAGEVVEASNGKVSFKGNGEKASVKNASKSLFTILDTHIQNVLAMKTVGSPAQHVVSPDDIQKFTQDKTDLADLMEA